MTAETTICQPDMTTKTAIPGASASAAALQEYLLQGVSRTFALTIPQLPNGLNEAVANGYLLCRIVDTIEDDPALSAEQKRQIAQQYVQVVAGESDAQAFAQTLAPLLSGATLPAEHELVLLTPEVIRITHSLTDPQREALTHCVRVMAEGMIYYQEQDTSKGLATLAEMETYCYYVAGVVGEMLCKLFCAYSPQIELQRDELLALSVTFGQGLQMTNILKDIWDDHARGACWLPQDVFSRYDFDLSALEAGQNDKGFEQGLEELIGIAFHCLQQGLEYTLLIPRHETGIRKFCYWSIGMAVSTLARVNRKRDFSQGKQVRITRNNVRLTIATGKLATRSDFLLRLLFRIAGRGLPVNGR
jgi:farnesyl-diphosphate farnesyltransferase